MIGQEIIEAFALLFYLQNGEAKKKAAPKKFADHYEPKVKTDLAFDQLIAMSEGKKREEKKNPD